MQLGFLVADGVGPHLLHLQGIANVSSSPISGVPIAILLGFAFKNLPGLTLPAALNPGLALCKTTLLRTGIVCVGAKLSLVDIATVGLQGLPAVCASITAGMLVVPWLGQKLGLSSRLSALVAAGSSICGVTAISALAPTIKATDRETAFAVANVVAFGTLNMLLMPYVAHALLPTSEQAGLFLGLAVHDTAQARLASRVCLCACAYGGSSRLIDPCRVALQHRWWVRL